MERIHSNFSLGLAKAPRANTKVCRCEQPRARLGHSARARARADRGARRAHVSAAAVSEKPRLHADQKSAGGAGSGSPGPYAFGIERTPAVRKTNGCGGPLHVKQILSLGLYVASLAGWLLFVVPFIPTAGHHQTIAVACYFGLFAVGLYHYVRIEVVDPIHERVTQRIEQPRADPVTGKRKYELVDLRQCTYCDIYIEPTTKHCYDCGKCIEHFDHHCHYLGTCVGAVNYVNFASLVTVLVLLFLIQIGESAYLLSISLNDDFDLQYFGSDDFAAPLYTALLAASALVPIVGAGLTGGLLGFHVWVVGCRRMTTWSWIIERRRVEDSKPKVLTKEELEQEARRKAAQEEQRKLWQQEREAEKAERARKAGGGGGRPATQPKLTMERAAQKARADAVLDVQVAQAAAAAGTSAASTSSASSAVTSSASGAVVAVGANGAVEMNLSASPQRSAAASGAGSGTSAYTAAAAATARSAAASATTAGLAADDKSNEWKEWEERQRAAERAERLRAHEAAAAAAAATAAAGTGGAVAIDIAPASAPAPAPAAGAVTVTAIRVDAPAATATLPPPTAHADHNGSGSGRGSHTNGHSNGAGGHTPRGHGGDAAPHDGSSGLVTPTAAASDDKPHSPPLLVAPSGGTGLVSPVSPTAGAPLLPPSHGDSSTSPVVRPHHLPADA